MFNAYTLNASSPYAHIDEIDYLVNIGQFLRPGKIVMLGAGPGVLALAAMDWYLRNEKEFPELVVVDNNTCQYASIHLNAMGVPASKLKFFVEDSAAFGESWEDTNISLLIVDADHSREAVVKDIDAWFSSVVPGGLIFFHDYLEREGGFNGSSSWDIGPVSEAIDDRFYLPWLLEKEVGISAVYRKAE